MTDTTDLERKRHLLQRRLDDGHTRIEQAAANGADVAAWETFWLTLLREYETVCEQLMSSSDRLQEDATIIPVGGSDRRRG